MSAPQTYKNHARFDPPFHFFVAPVLLITFIWSIVWYVHHFDAYKLLGAWMIVLSFALIVLAVKARLYALVAQDRVIRLEEKMRLASLVSPAELAELDSLTVTQYVGLRFASNPELPALARRAVRENLTRSQIKKSIVSWRADLDRV